jgi:hypothetical protein
MASELEVGNVSAGNVGINSASPKTKLHIHDASAGAVVTQVNLANDNDGASNGAGVRLFMSGRAAFDPSDTGAARGAIIEAKATDTNNAHGLSFWTSATGAAPTKRLEIDSEGNFKWTGDLNIYSDGVRNFELWDTGGNAAAKFHGTCLTTGLATFSSGIVTSEKGILSGSVTVAHHAVTTITPQRKGGFLMLSSDTTAGDGGYPQPADSSQIWFDCGSSLDIQKQTTDASTNIGVDVEVSTSDVTGTTGTSGKITVAVQTDVIKIENRSGGARTFNYTIIS